MNLEKINFNFFYRLRVEADNRRFKTHKLITAPAGSRRQLKIKSGGTNP